MDSKALTNEMDRILKIMAAEKPDSERYSLLMQRLNTLEQIKFKQEVNVIANTKAEDAANAKKKELENAERELDLKERELNMLASTKNSELKNAEREFELKEQELDVKADEVNAMAARSRREMITDVGVTLLAGVLTLTGIALTKEVEETSIIRTKGWAFIPKLLPKIIR